MVHYLGLSKGKKEDHTLAKQVDECDTTDVTPADIQAVEAITRELLVAKLVDIEVKRARGQEGQGTSHRTKSKEEAGDKVSTVSRRTHKRANQIRSRVVYFDVRETTSTMRGVSRVSGSVAEHSESSLSLTKVGKATKKGKQNGS